MWILRNVNMPWKYWNEKQGWIGERLKATLYTTREKDEWMWPPPSSEWQEF